MFFYKERKRTERTERSFEKNGCPTLEISDSPQANTSRSLIIFCGYFSPLFLRKRKRPISVFEYYNEAVLQFTQFVIFKFDETEAKLYIVSVASIIYLISEKNQQCFPTL